MLNGPGRQRRPGPGNRAAKASRCLLVRARWAWGSARGLGVAIPTHPRSSVTPPLRGTAAARLRSLVAGGACAGLGPGGGVSRSCLAVAWGSGPPPPPSGLAVAFPFARRLRRARWLA